MGRIRLPMGVMKARIIDVSAKGKVLSITADVGAAPMYVGKVTVELFPEDIRENKIGLAIWGVKAVFYKLNTFVTKQISKLQKK